LYTNQRNGKRFCRFVYFLGLAHRRQQLKKEIFILCSLKRQRRTHLAKTQAPAAIWLVQAEVAKARKGVIG
jgi:hypothetical protein